jgi:hypothetical protein
VKITKGLQVGGIKLVSSEYINNRQWSDQYHSAIEKIIKKIASRIITFSIAPDQEDMQQATDYIITVEQGTIACRIRKSGYYYSHRDFTIRSYCNGSKTELAKIKEGFGRWYIYAWAKDNDSLLEWWLLDLNALRASPLLDSERPETPNKDGLTAFKAFSASELYLWDVLIEKGGEGVVNH